jgi:hypothetical protein
MDLTAQGDGAKIQNKIVDDQRAIEEVSATREVKQSETAYPAIDARREAILEPPDSPGQIETEPGLESAADGVERDVIVTTGLQGEATKDEAATMNIEEAARNQSLQTHHSSFISHPTPQPVELTAEEDAAKIQNKIVDDQRASEEGAQETCANADSASEIGAEPTSFAPTGAKVAGHGLPAPGHAGPRRDVGPTTKAPSKERQNEILDEWSTNMRLSMPEKAEMQAWMRQLEEKVRRRKEGRKRERADQRSANP